MKQLDMFRRKKIFNHREQDIDSRPGSKEVMRNEHELWSVRPKTQRPMSPDATKKRRGVIQPTSVAAYKSLDNISEVKARILYMLRLAPRTDSHLEFLLPEFKPASVRTRRSELVRAGKVKDSGKRERLPSGRMAIVWCLVK